ncbi:hypothetical protein AVL62_04590 [Serinicoccus chungangensis]|uniref:Uncharacterized protein n=1 Tax=Serinicoccus chungangensis TaxID=767452 RepID=A0A0W8I879_9MICO|nr:amino acid racemase [Serinicoccus chungangensis]KUG55599.1 hypothetical protein AVL62_04590 [Serinicoccus chungangensis]
MLLCTNTMHKVADEVQAAIGIPLLHLADATAAAVRAAGLGRVGLLGTAFTMEQSFYTGRLADHGLEVLVPDAAGRELVHRVIYDELCRGVVREESREAYRRVVDDLVQRGAGRRPRLHRDRAAPGAGRRRRLDLPHHPAARRGRPGGGARGATDLRTLSPPGRHPAPGPPRPR